MTDPAILTRAQLVSRATKGGLALVAGGTLLAATAGTARGTSTSGASAHLSVFSDIASDDPVIPAFPKSLTADQATAAVTPSLA